MTLEEYKINIAIDLMRKIAGEINLKEIPAQDAFNIDSTNIEFFVCWIHKRRKAGIFLSKVDGFCYIPFGDSVCIGDIDKWKESFQKIIASLGNEAALFTSPTWNLLMQGKV